MVSKTNEGIKMPEFITHNLEAEEAVVGSCIYGSEYLHRINPQLMADDFYSERCSVLFGVILFMDKNNIAVNEVTIGQEVGRQNKSESLGGLSFIPHLLSIIPTPEDIISYADIVRRLSILRKLNNAGEQIKTLASNDSLDLADTLNKADNIILGVRKHGVPSPIITPKDRENLLLERYLKLEASEQGVAVKTGLERLDFNLGGGFYAGDVVIVGARPGMGKTTYLQTLANNISKTKTVLFCSAEMPVTGLSDRDVAGVIGVTTHQVRLGGYEHDIYLKILNVAIPELTSRNIYFYEDTPLTTDRILQACIAMKMRFGLDIVFIDYLGMLDDEYGRSQYERVGYISRRLKQLAKKIDVPVVIAHQLNRDVQDRNDKRPQLSDLRDSGKVEEDADVVMFLYRDSYYEETNQSRKTEVIIAKQRQGDSNKTVEIYFDKVHQEYTGLETRYEEGEQIND
jgi:replicative DNA helicase